MSLWSLLYLITCVDVWRQYAEDKIMMLRNIYYLLILKITFRSGLVACHNNLSLWNSSSTNFHPNIACVAGRTVQKKALHNDLFTFVTSFRLAGSSSFIYCCSLSTQPGGFSTFHITSICFSLDRRAYTAFRPEGTTDTSGRRDRQPSFSSNSILL